MRATASQRVFFLGLFIVIVILNCVGTLSFMMRVSSGLRIYRRSHRLFSQVPHKTPSVTRRAAFQSASQDDQAHEFCIKLEDSVYEKLTSLRISPQSNFLLSVSGGVDSMALLHIMQGIKTRILPELNIKVININHRQRQEAVEEAVFVEHWAKQYGLEAVLDTVPDSLAETKSGFQEAARNYRRERCLKALKDLFKEESIQDSFICLAHHLDDEMETLMLKFLRGVHISNFIAMESVSGVFLRPLLHLTKEQLVAYMQHKALQWRDDESNLSRNYKRNKVRLDLIPLMEELAGGKDAFRKRMSALVEQSEGVRQAMTYLNKEMLKKVVYANYPMYSTMSLPASFSAAPPLVLSDLLHQWMHSQDKVLSTKMLARIVEAIREGGRKKKEGTGLRFNTGEFDVEVLATNLADDAASTSNGLLSQGTTRNNTVSNEELGQIELRLVPKTPSHDLRRITTQLQIKALTMEVTHPAFVSVRPKKETEQIPPNSLLLPVVVSNVPSSNKLFLELRYKKEGDHFSMSSREGQGQSLSRFLQAQQVPLTQRDRVLVLVQQSGKKNETIVGVVIDSSKVLAKQGAPVAHLVVTPHHNISW